MTPEATDVFAHGKTLLISYNNYEGEALGTLSLAVVVVVVL